MGLGPGTTCRSDPAVTLPHDLIAQPAECARLIHESRRGDAQTPAWDELSDELRDMKASQIADIPRKLEAVGLKVMPADDPAAISFRPDPTELEALARMEHDRWCSRRKAHGWRLGPVRDDAIRIHPSLVAFETLSETEKQKDREMVLRIPEQLAVLGLAVGRGSD